jgi:hypothetical protein
MGNAEFAEDLDISSRMNALLTSDTASDSWSRYLPTTSSISRLEKRPLGDIAGACEFPPSLSLCALPAKQGLKRPQAFPLEIEVWPCVFLVALQEYCTAVQQLELIVMQS